MTAVADLTPVQRAITAAICDEEYLVDGWPITVRRLCELVGLASPSSGHVHLRNLIDIGVVEQSPYPRGGFRLTPAGEEIAIALEELDG